MNSTTRTHLLAEIIGLVCLAMSIYARPMDLRTPNLEPARGAPTQTAVFVHAGGDQLLSRGCMATSSVPVPCLGELSYITDGGKECEANEINMVKLSQGVQWVQIDLATSKVITAVCIWRYHVLPRVCRDVVVQLSDDATFHQGVVTVFNNDHDNSSGFGIGCDKEYIEDFWGKAITVNDVRARYVRVYSNGEYLEHGKIDPFNYYTEIEVYGGINLLPESVPLKVDLPRPQFR